MSFSPSSALLVGYIACPPRALNMEKNPINFCSTYFALVPYSFSFCAVNTKKCIHNVHMNSNSHYGFFDIAENL